MTDDEAKACLRALIAGFPKWEPDEDTVLLYAGTLDRWPFEVAIEGCKSVIENVDRSWPTVSALIGACQAASRRAARQNANPRALPEGPPENYMQIGKRRAGEIRAALRDGGTTTDDDN